jgi:hypothetical protein
MPFQRGGDFRFRPKQKWRLFTMSGPAAGNDAAVCHVDATFMISNVPRNIISTAT